MLLLQATNIQKSYGIKTVLDFPHFAVHEGDRIGIVGANGAGKSTLLGVLSRRIRPDRGSVTGDWEVCCIQQLGERDPGRSGGESAKARIRQSTAHSGQILLADEPTANLDAEGRRWVLQKLREASTLLLVSHDRELLDEICTKIVLLEDGALTEYTGNYSAYEAAAALERRQQAQAYEAYQSKRAQLAAAVQTWERNDAGMQDRKRADYKQNNSEARLARGKRAEKQKKVQRQSKVLSARLERLEPVEKLREPPALRIDFSLTAPPGNKNVITCRNLSFSYGEKNILCEVSLAIPNRAKVAVTGKNGAGKSTLLRLIHEGHTAISTAPKLRTGFLYQSFENLDMDKTVLDNVLSTSVQDHAAVRSVLAGLLFPGDEVRKIAGVLSGGEKMRLSLAKLLTGEANALLLDEPTNYLDLRAVEAVERMIAQYPGTVLLVSHDVRFVERVTEYRLHLRDGGAVFEKAEGAPAPATGAPQRLLLELRLSRLVAEISSAPPARKDVLERDYRETLDQLHRLG